MSNLLCRCRADELATWLKFRRAAAVSKTSHIVAFKTGAVCVETSKVMLHEIEILPLIRPPLALNFDMPTLMTVLSVQIFAFENIGMFKPTFIAEPTPATPPILLAGRRIPRS